MGGGGSCFSRDPPTAAPTAGTDGGGVASSLFTGEVSKPAAAWSRTAVLFSSVAARPWRPAPGR